MANSKASKTLMDDGINREQATVDTDPGSSGYYTDAVYTNGEGNLHFYIKACTGATVHLQWQHVCDSTSWFDYDADGYTAVGRYHIEDNTPGVKWRAGVKDNNQGTTSTFGLDW